MKPAILIIDDESSFISKMKYGFNNFDFREALSVEQARPLLTEKFDLILLDLKLNPSSDQLEGLAFIEPIKSARPDIPLVVVTSDESTDTVVTAMKRGADDFLRKSEFDLLAWAKKFELHIENKRLNEQIKHIETEHYPFVGNSPEIREIKKTLQVLADNPGVAVLITGETGVGKEVAARYLHQHSQRKNKPFFAVNLSSIQETLLESTLFGHKKGAFTGASYQRDGYFRRADGGILFLDEIGDTPPAIQVKLLRFLDTLKIQVVGDDEEMQLDVQIIAATNHDLSKLVEKGQFRPDLYYRLKNFQVDIPPLRHRQSDIEEIMVYYLKKQGVREPYNIFTPEVKEKLISYKWPGNVRELRNAIDYMLLKARVKRKEKIDTTCLPADIRNFENNRLLSEPELLKWRDKSLKMRIALAELAEIDSALIKTHGQKEAAAKLLGMNADQMRYRVLKWWKMDREILKPFSNILSKYKLVE